MADAPEEPFTITCNACQRREKCRPAVDYCRVCGEYMCTECLSNHNMVAMTNHHGDKLIGSQLYITMTKARLRLPPRMKISAGDAIFCCHGCANNGDYKKAADFCCECVEYFCPTCLMNHERWTKHSETLVGEADLRKMIDASRSVSKATPRSPVNSIDTCEYYCIRIAGDSNTCGAQGSCQLDDGGCLITDWSNRRLKRLNKQFCVCEYLDLPGQPWAVCSGFSEAAVSLPGRHVVVRVSLLGKMKIVREIKFRGRCWGVTCYQGQMFCVGEDDDCVVLWKLDWWSGEKKDKTVVRDESGGIIQCDYPRHVAVSASGDRVYIPVQQTGLVILDRAGDVLKVVRDFFLTWGVCVSDSGCVLVSGREEEPPGPGTVNQCNKDGEFISTIISKEQLKHRGSSSLTYIRDGSIIVVTLSNTDEIATFGIK